MVAALGQPLHGAISTRDAPELVAAIDGREEVDRPTVGRRDEARVLALGHVARDTRSRHAVVGTPQGPHTPPATPQPGATAGPPDRFRPRWACAPEPSPGNSQTALRPPPRPSSFEPRA